MTEIRTEAAVDVAARRMREVHDGLGAISMVIYGSCSDGSLRWVGEPRTGPWGACEVLAPGTGGLLTRPVEHGTADVEEMVATIRASLSLNISQSAKMLGVQRPTLYSWMREEAEPQPANLLRLRCIFGLARYWNQLSGRQPLGRRLHAEAVEQQSVFDLLVQEAIREVPLMRAFERLAKEDVDRLAGPGRSRVRSGD